MTHDFTGKAMAVTGSSGIGLGAALYLARSGARVWARRPSITTGSQRAPSWLTTRAATAP